MEYSSVTQLRKGSAVTLGKVISLGDRVQQTSEGQGVGAIYFSLTFKYMAWL